MTDDHGPSADYDPINTAPRRSLRRARDEPIDRARDAQQEDEGDDRRDRDGGQPEAVDFGRREPEDDNGEGHGDETEGPTHHLKQRVRREVPAWGTRCH